jgi:hypothetical protein
VGRKVDAEHLVGSGEIAERCGARRPSHVHWWWTHDSEFPQPIAVLGANSGRKTYVWYWPDVERWARKKGRLPD